MSHFANTNEQLQNHKTIEYRHHPLPLALSHKISDDSHIGSALALTLGRFIQSDTISLNLHDNFIRLDLSDDQTIADYLAQYQDKAQQPAPSDGEARYCFTILASDTQWQQLELPDIMATLQSANTDLAIAVALDEQTQCYQTFWASSSTAFNEQLLAELIQGFEQILTVLCENQSQTLGPIHALSPERYQQLIVQTNQTEFDFPDVCLFELFEQHAKSQPDAVALIYRGQSYSYHQLNQLSNQLASVLNNKGIGKGDIVAVSMAKSDLFVIALMAVVKSGAAYLPIDPNYPQSRVEMMLNDIKPPLILTVKDALDHTLVQDKVVLELDIPDVQQQMAAASDTNLQLGVTGDDLFYAIYTSGSTGAPKAILLNHRGRTSNFLDFIRRFGIKAGDSLLGVSSISFDMTAFDVFGILSCGATLIINGDELDPVGWAETIVDYEVSVWHSAPALFDLVLQALEQSGPHYDILRLTLLGGDWISLDMPAKYKAVSPDGIFVSLGGASEVSMDSTIYTVNEVSEHWCSIPYGKPMGNQRAYILDEALRPVPVGVAGQLFLGGIGVGNGYHNREALTKERFLPDPFHTPGARMYMTGDCARWMGDGEIELLGRLDFQVKINGLRIELGEIEHAIRSFEDVDKAVVVRAGPITAGQLVAFYTSFDGQKAISQRITEHLEQVLPSFMVPGHIVELQQFKLSPNGKVDRSALMAQAVSFVTPDRGS